MLVQNMASLVVAWEENVWLLWNKHAKDEMMEKSIQPMRH